jgi:hypothetical protein
MQAVRGHLENGRFVPLEAITLPSHAEVTILFRDAIQALIHVDEKAFWAEFDRMTAESADENEQLSDEAFTRRPSRRELVTFSDEG